MLSRLETAKANRAYRREQKHIARAARKVQYRQGSTARYDGWCWRHALIVLTILNVVLFFLGVVIIVLGVYALESNWVNLLGHGGAVAALACGIGTSVTAVAGIYGVSKRTKCILLLYFLVVLTALVVYLVVGATALFSNESFDTRFSKLWCDKQAQTMFNCCGYNCPFDRPAQGFCAGKLLPNATLAPGVVAPPLSRCSDSNPVVVECQNIAIAAGFPQGCKSKALNFINQRFVPLFVLALVFGLFLILAFSLSFRLLCRSDPQNHAALSDKDSFVFAAQLNQWNPSSGSVRAEA